MSGFDEYAALLRELSTRQRGGEREIAAEAERRRGLQAAVDKLGQRLVAQGQHLDRLGQAIGTPMTSVPAPAPAVAVAAGPAAPEAADAGGRTGAGRGEDAGGRTGAGPGHGVTGGAAAAPGQAGVGAYPSPGVAPRAGDPAAELAAAERLAGEADGYGQQADALARTPVLLPTWSAPARAVAVYGGCALVGSLLMLVALVGSPVPVAGLDLVAALSCAGVPLLSFVAGQVVLARWGRPALAGGEATTGRYVPLGFVICALVSPSLFCVYLLLFRLLR
ncbi:Tfp pilus assembly protein FimV [Micromonospora sp. HB375]|uniref:hypothetical protein n=1 Tax=unclassified Micromonospora TaxID=2617518 RepID=UPI001AE2397C|nr:MULTISPECIES: hypothetical protein [unclassified Micromonospora]MBP1784588.1 Tfp pilus assembly protein FimV [Micromonospora sp. HB375]MDH6471690.1 Tfp pilus assembly protein FimV [Micromonospora sp. H404/HB375]